ncbi:DNA-binding protein [Endothiovibrio diazotrophicus]
MNPYEFTLAFSLRDPAAGAESHLDALFEAGCDDALVGSGVPGILALDFLREGVSAEAAVRSAVEAVCAAIPGAELIEAKPDLVGVSEIAALAHCSRQNVRKYLVNLRSGFPLPVHSGSVPLWHLLEVVEWFGRSPKPAVAFDPAVAELAATTLRINLEGQSRRYARLLAGRAGR